MTPENVVIVQGAGPDSIRIERAPRAGEYGWSVTAYGIDADHAILKARRMVAEAENLVNVARGHEAEARGAAPPPAPRRAPARTSTTPPGDADENRDRDHPML